MRQAEEEYTVKFLGYMADCRYNTTDTGIGPYASSLALETQAAYYHAVKSLVAEEGVETEYGKAHSFSVFLALCKLKQLCKFWTWSLNKQLGTITEHTFSFAEA
jgi:hypothetical protein